MIESLLLTDITDNANKMVYDRLAQWIVRAFNGEYLKLGPGELKPIDPEKAKISPDRRLE